MFRSMSFRIASELRVNASRAVAPSVSTPLVIRAMSGSAETCPVAVTVTNRCTGFSSAAARPGPAIKNAAAQSASKPIAVDGAGMEGLL
jgi:hypothetical protein